MPLAFYIGFEEFLRQDIVTATSAISFVDGIEERLIYRGYDIKDLGEHSTFEETVYLIWYSALPTNARLSEFSSQLIDNSLEANKRKSLRLVSLKYRRSSPPFIVSEKASLLFHPPHR